MRWTQKQSPEDGETRVKKRFLLFPKTIKGETRWLEWATWEQRWKKECPLKGRYGIFSRWIDECWLNQNTNKPI